MTGDLVVRWPVQRVLQVMAAGLTPKNQFSCEMSYGNVAATGSPRYIFCFFFLFPPLLDSRSHVASRENCVVPRLLCCRFKRHGYKAGLLGNKPSNIAIDAGPSYLSGVDYVGSYMRDKKQEVQQNTRMFQQTVDTLLARSVKMPA